MRFRPSSVPILALALLVAILGGGRTVGRSPMVDTVQATPATLLGVSSIVLGSGAADAAPGHDLAVGRVTIEPGATIPPHVHPGTQVATIVSGELTYTVLSGEMQVTIATPGGTTEARSVVAGETVVLRGGDSVAEQPGAAHTARNAGSEPVVILLATLFPKGEARTIEVDATPSA